MMVPTYYDLMETVEDINTAARILYGWHFALLLDVAPDSPMDPAKLLHVRSALAELRRTVEQAVAMCELARLDGCPESGADGSSRNMDLNTALIKAQSRLPPPEGGAS